ncbi:hypothetical protein Ciccas_013526 [Cichlidogyrus casuarinus]|uniref:Uncharacterized protein n=1 Tax=Cichlidogyrus casuarinus TaxID=1844966 RepID=A0ABD2PLK8_9PLAT
MEHELFCRDGFAATLVEEIHQKMQKDIECNPLLNALQKKSSTTSNNNNNTNHKYQPTTVTTKSKYPNLNPSQTVFHPMKTSPRTPTPTNAPTRSPEEKATPRPSDSAEEQQEKKTCPPILSQTQLVNANQGFVHAFKKVPTGQKTTAQKPFYAAAPTFNRSLTFVNGGTLPNMYPNGGLAPSNIGSDFFAAAARTKKYAPMGLMLNGRGTQADPSYLTCFGARNNHSKETNSYLTTSRAGGHFAQTNSLFRELFQYHVAGHHGRQTPLVLGNNYVSEGGQVPTNQPSKCLVVRCSY